MCLSIGINYYHCKEIIQILEQTEKDTRGIFGTYRSQRMKDWLQIVRLYEKDNVYLAEIAQLFIRNIKYEIPNIRKHATKLEQQLQENNEKCENLKRTETQYLSERSALLQQLGIKGEEEDDIKGELLEAINILPKLYEQTLLRLGKLKVAHEIYASTVNRSDRKSVPCLPIMKHLLESGNTTVYEYIHKEQPKSVEEPPIPLAAVCSEEQQQQDVEEEGGIDFGEDEDLNIDVIDYGDDITSFEVTASGESPEANPGKEEKVQINFDIPLEEYGIVVDRANVNGSIAKGDQAFTLLDSPTYRERFIDELYELESFIRISLYLCSQSGSGGHQYGTDSALDQNFMFALSSDTMTEQLCDPKVLEDILSAITNVLQSINDEQLVHLHQIKHSAKYADLLMNKLQQMLRRVERIRGNRVTIKEQMETLKEERVKLNPILSDLQKQTKELQEHIAEDISQRYNKRVVNILGGCN